MIRAATYCELANSTKSPEVDPDIYQDKANQCLPHSAIWQ